MIAKPVRRSTTFHQARYVVLALIAGALTGLFGGVFHLVIDTLIKWPSWLAVYVSGWPQIAASAVITMTATLAAVILTRRLAPEAGGSGVPEIEGAMEDLRHVRWKRVLPVKFFAGVAAIGSGLVLGREGPTIHMGGSAAMATSDMFRVYGFERRGLLAAGAAAGLACAFNAPLAAVLFVIEETRKQFPYTFRTYMGVFAAAITSTVVTQLISGTRPDLPISVATAALGTLPAFAVLGVVLGAIGVLLNLCIMASLDFADGCHRRAPYVWPAFVGLLTGALVVLLPNAVTGGESVIQTLVVTHPGVIMLLVLAAARFVTSVTSYSTGVPGGIFAPILALATCIGLAFGGALQMLLPDTGLAPLAFGIAAMGGLFTASVRSPIVGVALVMELTGAYSLALPLLVVCTMANLTAQWMGGRPIYEQMLARTLRLAGKTAAPHDAELDVGLAAEPKTGSQ